MLCPCCHIMKGTYSWQQLRMSYNVLAYACWCLYDMSRSYHGACCSMADLTIGVNSCGTAAAKPSAQSASVCGNHIMVIDAVITFKQVK